MTTGRAANPIRVVIADDHAVVRQAIHMMLELEQDIRVVGEASGGREAVALCEDLGPDLILMDIRMKGMDGVQATRLLRDVCPGIAVLVLTAFADDQSLLHAVEAGAHGFLLKEASKEELLDAIRRVVRGESLITPSMLRRLLSKFAERSRRASAGSIHLTSREVEVLQALAQGLSNESIAAKLGISQKTVKTHLGNIFRKIQVDNRSQAILFALREGLVEV